MRLVALFFTLISSVFGTILNDGKLECDEILANKTRLFSSDFDLKTANVSSVDFECAGSLLSINDVKNLLNTTLKIRSEDRSCVGRVADINLNNFKFLLLKAGVAPEIYAKTLLAPDEYEAELEKNRAFFRYWGHQSLSNFLLFKEFNKNYNETLEPLVKHYMSNFRIDQGSAIYYATKAVNEFLKFALALKRDDFGKGSLDISDIQKRISDPKSLKYEINELIYSGKISKDSIQNAFNTALLYEKDFDILKEFIQMGVNLNDGYESSIFFALKNLKNVQFLLDNGADVDYANLMGQTPLFKAVGLNDTELVKLLVRSGANVNSRTIDVNTKLAYNSNLGEVLPNYIKLCDFEHTSRTILMEAASSSNVEIVKFLIAIGVDLNAVDDAGFNAVDYAILGKNTANLEYLKSLGLKSNFEN